MGILDQYSLPTITDSTPVSVDFGGMDLETIISNIDNMSEDDISKDVKSILAYHIKEENIPNLVTLLCNQKFMIHMARIASSFQFNYNQKVLLNMIILDAIKAGCTKDEYSKSITINLVKRVNKDLLPKINMITQDEEVAALVLLRRYSSFNESECVIRLNSYLMKALDFSKLDVEGSEQLIVNLYDALFYKVTPLFEGIMFDTREARGKLPDNENEIFGVIGLAILDVLNNMPSQYIYTILKSYADTYRLLYNSSVPVRYSMDNVNATDYGRILQMVQALRNEGYYIP